MCVNTHTHTHTHKLVCVYATPPYTTPHKKKTTQHMYMPHREGQRGQVIVVEKRERRLGAVV